MSEESLVDRLRRRLQIEEADDPNRAGSLSGLGSDPNGQLTEFQLRQQQYKKDMEELARGGADTKGLGPIIQLFKRLGRE